MKRTPKPATLEELAVIIDDMPERLRLFIVLAAFVGLREGELSELRRSDVDGVIGRIGSPARSRRTSTRSPRCVPRLRPRRRRAEDRQRGPDRARAPPFLPMLQKHLLEHTAAGPTGLLFPGDRRDHMSVRYLMDRYRPAREAAGRPDLTVHHLRHTALTLAGQHGATAAELQARAGHASQAAMAIYQHATLDRDKSLAEKIGATEHAARERTVVLGEQASGRARLGSYPAHAATPTPFGSCCTPRAARRAVKWVNLALI